MSDTAIGEILDIGMFAVACIVLLAGFPVAFTLAGVALIFAVLGWSLGVFDLSFIRFIPQRIFGTMTNEVLIAVPLFVFMGVMLERSKVAEELLENMGRLFGTLRGGLGISVSVVGALLAASTGIVGATVVTMGLLSLPTMLRNGYDPKLACGSICAAGTLGQIIPPSIVLVILGDQISNSYQQVQLEMQQKAWAEGDYSFSPDTVSVGDLFAGALLPGLMLVGMYIVYQIVIAIIRPASSPPLPEDVARAGMSTRQIYLGILKVLLPPVILIIAVLGSILAGIATPTEAAGVGSIGALLLAGLKLDEKHGWSIYGAALCLVALLIMTGQVDLRVTRTTIPPADMVGIGVAILLCLGLAWGILISLWRVYRTKVLHQVMRSTAQISSMVFIILIGAALFSLVFRGLGGDEAVRHFLEGLPGGTATAVFVVMAVMFFLGFFLDFIEITFVVVPIVGPILLAMGLDPVWLGIMMAINLQTSFLTPPFGFALFYLRGVAPPSIKTMEIYKGVIPFVIIQLIGLAIVAQFPQLATWLPDVVFG
ncbi:MAG: TRAP transporter large permease subunit [Deinococcus-Thermus bacterium]|jgi:tripartite ATP-independent transporter DctM subunit|nr:TRAP transporter large permease subunit [Deinococcota bacterium]